MPCSGSHIWEMIGLGLNPVQSAMPCWLPGATFSSAELGEGGSTFSGQPWVHYMYFCRSTHQGPHPVMDGSAMFSSRVLPQPGCCRSQGAARVFSCSCPPSPPRSPGGHPCCNCPGLPSPSSLIAYIPPEASPSSWEVGQRLSEHSPPLLLCPPVLAVGSRALLVSSAHPVPAWHSWPIPGASPSFLHSS